MIIYLSLEAVLITLTFNISIRSSPSGHRVLLIFLSRCPFRIHSIISVAISFLELFVFNIAILMTIILKIHEIIQGILVKRDNNKYILKIDTYKDCFTFISGYIVQ